MVLSFRPAEPFSLYIHTGNACGCCHGVWTRRAWRATANRPLPQLGYGVLGLRARDHACPVVYIRPSDQIDFQRCLENMANQVTQRKALAFTVLLFGIMGAITWAIRGTNGPFLEACFLFPWRSERSEG